MFLKPIIKAMCIEQSAAESREIVIRTSYRVLYRGAINKIPKEIINHNWMILDINPERNKKFERRYANTPDYNLPYIINVF